MTTHSVLMVSRSLSYGGVERVIEHLVNHLKPRSWQFAMAPLYESEFTEHIRREDCLTFVLPRLAVAAHRFDAPGFSALLRLVEEVKPTLIHGHGFEAAGVARAVVFEAAHPS
jgi:hypothetical protein